VTLVFHGPRGVAIDHAADSDSSDVPDPDGEVSPLAEVQPSIMWRGLFRLALLIRGIDMPGSGVFTDVCQDLDSRYRSLLGSAPLPFLRAMFDACCVQLSIRSCISISPNPNPISSIHPRSFGYISDELPHCHRPTPPGRPPTMADDG
jgi:hypothetical protein